jgi:hypothetical protein
MTKYSFIVLYLILIKEVFDSELYYKKVYLDEQKSKVDYRSALVNNLVSSIKFVNYLNTNTMKKNMGNIDRIIRIIVAVVILILFLKHIIVGTLAYVLLAFAAIFVLTSFIGFCPIYKLLGINSCENKK